MTPRTTIARALCSPAGLCVCTESHICDQEPWRKADAVLAALGDMDAKRLVSAMGRGVPEWRPILDAPPEVKDYARERAPAWGGGYGFVGRDKPVAIVAVWLARSRAWTEALWCEWVPPLPGEP